MIHISEEEKTRFIKATDAAIKRFVTELNHAAGADVAGQVADKASPVLNKTLELIEQKLDEELKGTKRERNNE